MNETGKCSPVCTKKTWAAVSSAQQQIFFLHYKFTTYAKLNLWSSCTKLFRRIFGGRNFGGEYG